MGQMSASSLLNSPIEVGIRSVALLTALYPRSADISMLVLLDHVLLHTSDFGGAESIHPPVPGRGSQIGLKRGLIQDGLHLAGARGLVEQVVGTSGIAYIAGEDAHPFLQSFDSEYLEDLQDRCKWVARVYGDVSEEQLRNVLLEVVGQWREEFGDEA